MKREEMRARAAERCWASIGVLGGDRSCPLLVDLAHCRQCEVLTVAAHGLLAKLPVESAEAIVLRTSREGGEAGRVSATIPGTIEAPAETLERPLSVITFEVGGQSLALEARRVVEVSNARPVRRVPHRTSPAFTGLVNVQGRLEPCFSLGAVLGLPPTIDELAEPRLLVIGDDARRCAFLVQRVSLREADLALVGDPPLTVSGALDTHVRGILRLGDRPWSWLDADRLLASLEKALV